MNKAILIKDGKPIKTIYYVTNVVPNKKYGYFEITEKINHYEIITIHRFADVDRVELYKEDEHYARYELKPFKVVERE